MSNTISSGRLALRFTDLKLEGIDPEDVEHEIRDRIEAILKHNWPEFGLAVTDMAFDDLITETPEKVAEIEVHVRSTFTVAYDPDVYDIVEWTRDNSESLVKTAVDNGDYDVTVESDDSGMDPSFADWNATDF
jgi:hypothetical protein